MVAYCGRMKYSTREGECQTPPGLWSGCWVDGVEDRRSSLGTETWRHPSGNVDRVSWR